ncbi:4Fe-4S ferredoxin [Streptomyces sp. AP-93]|nr:4Fe-4S ferredoxin [Streptomyces sp. AP-93]
MPVESNASSDVPSGRPLRIATRSRAGNWTKPPRRIETSECITCDTCLRSCPEEFGAIFDRGLDVVIIPELCSGCPRCVLECPVDCIYVDEDWTPTDDAMWSHIALTGEGAA